MSDFLTIDSNLRTISIPDDITSLGVESDDGVTRLPFKLPRYHGEFDLSEFKVRINYKNANGEGDVYVPEDVVVTDDGFITFSWLVERFATMSKGSVEFGVCLKKMDEDDVVIKEFNTVPATREVLKGLETTEAVVQNYPDVLESILLSIDELKESNGSGGGITEETDPTVPAWAKADTKPSYTADEVGAYSKEEIDTALGTYITDIDALIGGE